MKKRSWKIISNSRIDESKLTRIDTTLLNNWDKKDSESLYPTIGQAQTGYGHANLALTHGFEWRSSFAELFEYLSKEVPKSDVDYTIKKRVLNGDTEEVKRNLRDGIIYRLSTIINHAFMFRRYEERNNDSDKKRAVPFEYEYVSNPEIGLQTLRFGKQTPDDPKNIIKNDPNVTGGSLVLNPMLGGMYPADFNGRATEFIQLVNDSSNPNSKRNHIKPLSSSGSINDKWDDEHNKIQSFLNFIFH